MGSLTVPPPFRTVEGRALQGPVPPSFEAFYRSHLRYRTGARIRSADLRTRYLAWAEQHGAPALSFIALRRAMENVGHRHLLSNGAFYEDVALQEDALELADNFPAPALIAPDAAAALVGDIDRVAGELDAIRAKLARLSNHGVTAHG